MLPRLTFPFSGSDLHTYHGILGSKSPPWVMGHEVIGIVTSAGDGVNTLKVGDRVVVDAEVMCGYCDHCVRGGSAYCLNVNPGADFEIYGFGADFDPADSGAQAEYLRVQFADSNCYILPPGSANELDFLLMSDHWGTAWYGLDAAGFQSGDSVAVFGAGSVGLLCAYTALLRGASRVYSVDHVASRLGQAKALGAIPINFRDEDPVERIMHDLPLGVRRSVDCIGYECVDRDLKPKENIVLEWAVAVTGWTGAISGTGVCITNQGPTAGAPKATEKTNSFEFPYAQFWLKGLSFKAGVANFRVLFPQMRDLIVSGRAKPAFVFSKEIRIEEAAEAYKLFSAHKQTKIAIRFPWAEEEGYWNGVEVKEAVTPSNGTEIVMKKPAQNGVSAERKTKRARRN